MVDPAPDPSFYSSLLCRLAGLEREFLSKKSIVTLMFLLSKTAHSAREGGQAAALGQSGLEKKLAEVGCRKKTGAWRTGNRQSQSGLE